MTASAAPQPTIVKYPRTLVVDAAVPNGGSLGVTLTIPSDADFEWWWLAAFRTSSLMKVQIQEAATTRFLIYNNNGTSGGTFQGIFIDLLAGLVSNNGAFPQTVPYVMPANRLYNHTFTDQTSGAVNNVELAYIGYALLQFAGASSSGS